MDEEPEVTSRAPDEPPYRAPDHIEEVFDDPNLLNYIHGSFMVPGEPADFDQRLHDNLDRLPPTDLSRIHGPIQALLRANLSDLDIAEGFGPYVTFCCLDPKTFLSRISQHINSLIQEKTV
jgi:hypothetical protein